MIVMMVIIIAIVIMIIIIILIIMVVITTVIAIEYSCLKKRSRWDERLSASTIKFLSQLSF